MADDKFYRVLGVSKVRAAALLGREATGQSSGRGRARWRRRRPTSPLRRADVTLPSLALDALRAISR